MSRRSDPVDPLLGCTLFPKAKFSSDPSKPYDFDHDLQAIDLHLNSTTASLSGLQDQAKNIFSGSSVIPQSDMSQALKCVNGVVPANDVDNHRERRPALGLKRARFSLEPNSSQPDINLGPTFDSKKYKEPNEYLTVYERNENAKRELEKQMGGAVLDGDEQNPSSITGARRPGILQRSVKYKHRISSLHNEIIENAISTQETFETSILSPLNHSSQTESHEKVALEEMDLAVKVPKKKPCKGKPIDKMDDLALLDELINEGEDSLHINVDLDTGKVDLTEEEALLEIPDEFMEAEEDLQSSEKKKRKHHHHRDSEVTYTGKNVVGADAKKPRVSHQMTLETSQSLGLLAPNVPVVPKKPIKQLFSRYGVADEKFVRSMLADLKDIDLDRVRAKDNSPQENRRIARESLMRALYNVYSIDASEEGTQLKEEVSNLSGKVKYLHGEKGKLEKERDALNQNIAALTLKVSELEEERKKIPALEVQVEALRKELEPLRGFEEKANSWKAKAEYLEGQIDEERHQAVEEYKGSQELVDLLLAARSKCISEKYCEWSASGWIDAEKMKREVAEMKRKRQEEQARKEAESKSGSSGSHTEAQE